MTLLQDVAAVLAEQGVAHALIGAAALAAHGVSRSTVDQDLLVVDRRVLDRPFWARLPQDVTVDARRGEDDDPLAGVVRISREGERDVDVVVGRHKWQADIVARAVAIEGSRLRVAERADLILMKLYAGGSQDRWDIEQLLAIDPKGTTISAVDARAGALPARSRELWAALRPES